MNWIRLDLRSKTLCPRAGMLVALRMEPTNGAARFFGTAHYDIGTFETESMNSKSKKLWWHGTRGVDNPTRLRKHYDIWWIPIREFDCYGG